MDCPCIKQYNDRTNRMGHYHKTTFDRYCLDKYGSYDTLFNGIHHYESLEVKNSIGVTIVKEGKRFLQDFSVQYFDIKLGQLSPPITWQER